MDLNFGTAKMVDHRFFGYKKPQGLMPCLRLTVTASVASNKWDSSWTANDLLDCKPWEALEDVCLIIDKYGVYYSFSCVCEIQIALSNKGGGLLVFLVAI